ncbi:MAG: lamin tail domain-containing protein [Deinococcus sp.]|nr:lamin tail domain-containing protein [Deinococcus sp.]
MRRRALALGLAAGLLPLALAQGAATVLISEVGFSSSEFVELLVLERTNLEGYVLSDADRFSYTFHADGVSLEVEPETMVLVRNSQGTAERSGNLLTLYTGRDRGFLNDGGDDLTLFDSKGIAVAYLAYGTGEAVDPAPEGLWSGNSVPITASSTGLALMGTEPGNAASWTLLDEQHQGSPGQANPGAAPLTARRRR